MTDPLSAYRDRLEQLVTPALDALAVALGPKPPRNIGTTLKAALAVLDRAGLGAINRTTLEHSGPGGGPVESTLTVRFVRAPVIEAEPQKAIEEKPPWE